MNRKVETMEDDNVSYRVVCAAGGTGSATSLTITDYKPFVKYGTWYVEETGELIRVGATPTSTSVTVARGVGGTSAATIPAGATLRYAGAAYTENEELQAAVSTQKSFPYNYIQDFRDAIEMSDHQIESASYGGKDLPYQMKKKLEEHLRAIENALWFGSRGVVSSTTQYTLGGILEFITTNLTDVSASGLLTRETFLQFLKDVFRFGGKKKMCFHGSGLATAMDAWGWELQRINPGAEKLGIKINEYITPFGTLGCVYHPQVFEGDTFSGHAVVIDPQYFALKYFAGIGKTHMGDHTKSTSKTGQNKEYRTNLTLVRQLEKASGVLSGVAG